MGLQATLFHNTRNHFIISSPVCSGMDTCKCCDNNRYTVIRPAPFPSTSEGHSRGRLIKSASERTATQFSPPEQSPSLAPITSVAILGTRRNRALDQSQRAVT